MESRDLQEIGAQLKRLGLIDEDVRRELKDSDRFGGVIAIAHKYRGNDKLLIRFHIRKNEEIGIFTLDDYNALLIKVPPYRHGVFNGIDTERLEQKLAENEWNLRTIPLPCDGKDVSETFFQVIDLVRCEDKQANDIAEKLMMKYWSETPMERLVALCPDPAVYERRMVFPVNNDLNDIDDLQAFNLLSGRAVMRFEEVEAGSPLVDWVTVVNGEFVKHSDFDVAGQLRKLAFETALDNASGPEYLLELAKGNRIPVVLKSGEEGREVLIEADPRNAVIAVFDKMERRLELNQFLVKEESDMREKKVKQNLKQPTSSKRKRGKGKGI